MAAGLPHLRAWIVGEIDYGGGAVVEEWWWHGIWESPTEELAGHRAANIRRQWAQNPQRDEPNPQLEVQRLAWREPCRCSCGALEHEVDKEAWIVRQTTWDGLRDAVREKAYRLNEAEVQRESEARKSK